MASPSLEQLDGMMQRIYSGDSRYVLISKVQFGSLWTIEIGSIGEPKPRWWRSMLDAGDIPTPLTPETIATAIVEGELHLSGLSGTTDASPKLKFYPSRVDSGSIHLMSYSAEESAQRAEKIIFEFASTAQKFGCRIFSPSSATNATITPATAPTIPRAAISLPSDPPPASSSDGSKEMEIKSLKEQLQKSETTVRNLQDQVIAAPNITQSKGNDQPPTSKAVKPKPAPTHRKRVVERVEFESDSDGNGKPQAASTTHVAGRSMKVPAQHKPSSKAPMGQPRKKRVVAKNEFESDDG